MHGTGVRDAIERVRGGALLTKDFRPICVVIVVVATAAAACSA